MFCLPACLFSACVQCPWRPERSVEPPELELKTVVGFHVCVKIKPMASAGVTSAFIH